MVGRHGHVSAVTGGAGNGGRLPPIDYGDRRNRAFSRLGDGAIVLPAAPVRLRSGDSEYRYRADSELLYLTGWDRPGGIALLRGFADEDRFVLFVPERDPARELWTGPRPDPDEAGAAHGADKVLSLRDFSSRAPALLAGADGIWYRLGAHPGCDGVVREALREGRSRRPRDGVGPWRLMDPGGILGELRLRKERAEIVRIKRAAAISVAAFREALPRIRAGAGEWEVEAALECGFRSRSADGPAFATIVAAGVNACTLHYTANDARIRADDLVLVDGGAEFDCYAADVTRTVPASGRLEGARLEAYQVVSDAHRAALAACAPGGTLDEVHEAAVRVVAEGLVALGVLPGPPGDVVDQALHRPFFPHQTSHWLGLDAHDAGPYRDRGKPVKLQPGMVFTVEPGLYLRPGSCPGSPGLEGVGIRIEDDVLITPEGVEVLSSGLPVDMDELLESVFPPPLRRGGGSATWRRRPGLRR